MSNRAHLRGPDGRRLRPTADLTAPAPAAHAARVAVAESAAPPISPIQIDEATAPGMTSTGGLRYRARLIEGDRWGTSGYYPAAVLKRDGPKVWPAGTQMYIDHPTPTEEAERPVRSVRDIGARTITTPVYERDGLYADVEIFPHAAPLLVPMAETIGLSVRGEATANWGSRAGRDGWIVESLTRGDSVDFVTRAGAGGALMSLAESARTAVQEARNVGAWLESRVHLDATAMADDLYGQGRVTREERIALSSALGAALAAWTTAITGAAPQLFNRDIYDSPGPADTAVSEHAVSEAPSAEVMRVLADLVADAYGAAETYTWVRDYDADRHLVWFDVSADGDCTTYQQAYTADDAGALALSGDRVEAVARTVYSPVETPDGADVVESAPPPPALPASTDGVPPAVQNPPEEVAVVAAESTGPAPGAAGPADTGGQPQNVNEAALTAQLRVAEQARDEAIARAQALTEARNAAATATAERDQAIAEARMLRANDAGRSTISRMLAEASNVPAHFRGLIAPRVAERVIGRVPLTEASGEVDVTALEAAVTAAIEAESTHAAAILEAAGAGRVAGLGGALKPGEMSEQDFDTQLGSVFADLGLSEADVRVAVKGR